MGKEGSRESRSYRSIKSNDTQTGGTGRIVPQTKSGPLKGAPAALTCCGCAAYRDLRNEGRARGNIAVRGDDVLSRNGEDDIMRRGPCNILTCSDVPIKGRYK